MTSPQRAVPVLAAVVAVALAVGAAAQQNPAPAAPEPPPIRIGAVTPIAAPPLPLPPESASAGITKFSFVAYGDTRCDCRIEGADARNLWPARPEVEPEHAAVVDAMIARVNALARTDHPVRFVVQSGDATYRGADAERWPVFGAIAERITVGAGLPFYFVPGNHDVTGLPATEPSHTLGLHNTLTAVSKLIPPEGSPRRLAGYGTFSFGYGNLFVIGFDSNLAEDRVQLAWVADQLEHLDRARFRHVIAVFHHPAFSSGRYSGVTSAALLPNGQTAASGSVGAPSLAIRSLYLPLFRKHHVRLLLTGHDHLFDHWVERYVDDTGAHRMDQIISGGGGAPTYVYTGEPDLAAYLAAGAQAQVRVEHLARPGATLPENPHHFLVIQVDGDELSVETVGVTPYAPYNGSARQTLGR